MKRWIHALELKVPPAVVFLAIAGGMKLLESTCPFASFEMPGRRPLAILLLATGGLLGAAGIGSFLRAHTTVLPHRPQKATTLVTGGIYRISRNPMYVGLLFVLGGWSVALSNGLAMFLLPGFVAYLDRFQIRPEEEALRARFGEKFDAYARTTRRWL